LPPPGCLAGCLVGLQVAGIVTYALWEGWAGMGLVIGSAPPPPPQAPAAFLVAERIRHTAAGFVVATVAAFGAAASLASAVAVVEAATAAYEAAAAIVNASLVLNLAAVAATADAATAPAVTGPPASLWQSFPFLTQETLLRFSHVHLCVFAWPLPTR
jgi:hypothetical protein